MINLTVVGNIPGNVFNFFSPQDPLVWLFSSGLRGKNKMFRVQNAGQNKTKNVEVFFGSVHPQVNTKVN